MSTRATVHFQYEGKTQAIVYRHSDGYPEGLGDDSKAFAMVSTGSLSKDNVKRTRPRYRTLENGITVCINRNEGH